MSGIGYKPCLADSSIWLNLEVRDDGVEYYSYILCYVDYILFGNQDARPASDCIDQSMKLKEGSIGDPDIFLGAKLKKIQMSNNV